MRLIPTELPDVLQLEPTLVGDARGSFMESFHQGRFDAAVGSAVRFVQDNQSTSRLGVLRGLHYQLPPHAQGKLVRVVQGAAFDVAVDIRHASPTFGRWTAALLDSRRHLQHWLPAGFAHGFLALEEDTVLLYKTTAFYAAHSEAVIAWNDPAIDIAWPQLRGVPILAAKDMAAPSLAQAVLPQAW